MKLRKIDIPEATGRPRTIAIIVYDGCEILDVTAPVEAFEMANRTLSEQGLTQPGYINILLAEQAGFITTSSGLRLVADSWCDCTDSIDTLIVVGSPDSSLGKALANNTLIHWIKNSSPHVRRIVSICTGAFILAEAGLLDGRRATTHWMNTEQLGRDYPFIQVEPDSIFVKDGAVATSAGATAGLDLALSLIEDDFGKKLALSVARRLVLYLKRPGGQTQFSTHLRAQMVTGGSLSAVLTRLESDFHLKTTVDDLAEQACMSPRNFARTFLRETGTTPAKYIELIRLEHTTRLLEDTNQPIAAIATECGYSSTEHLRRAFQKHMGISPNAYRERF
jgi:transcriptional regulator GlxA family with amidase domain